MDHSHNNQSGGQNHTPPAVVERELPMLAGIGAFVSWCEDLLNILSGPIITAGLAIALVALLTDGDLLVRIPMMLYIWAGSMALGLDAQFVGSAAKMARAVRARRFWAVFGYGVLCLALGYVGYIASNVFATQEANGITTAQALQHLGMDGSMWIVQRSALAVMLVFLSGFLRYTPPGRNVAATAAEEAERLRAEIELAPLRAQAQAAKLRGMRGAVLAGLGRDGQPSPNGGKASIRAVGAAATLADSAPAVHQDTVPSYKQMHDWDIPDEAETYDDAYGTRSLPESRDYWDENDVRAQADSGPIAGNVYPDDEVDYPPQSAHQRKKGKSSSGHRNQRQRVAELARKSQDRQADHARNRDIDEAVRAIYREVQETGEELSSYALEDKVNAYLARTGSPVRTTRKTVMRRFRELAADHAKHVRKQQDTAPIPDDIMAMLETEHEEAEEALV